MTTPDLHTLHAQAAAAGMAGRQIDFAKFVGWDKAHITRLKQRGLVVARADGAVDFAATLARIIAHADPARDRTRQVNAERRAAAAAVVPAAAPRAPALPARHADDGPPDESRTPDKQGFAATRARKEHWLAETARVEYEKLTATLVEAAAVQAAVEDAAAILRSGLENLPHRLAPEFVGKDLDEIRSTLRAEAQKLLGEWHAAFGRAAV